MINEENSFLFSVIQRTDQSMHIFDPKIDHHANYYCSQNSPIEQLAAV